MTPDRLPANRASPYYMHAAKVPMASRVSLRVRRVLFEQFMHTMNPSPEASVLDLGVTNDTSKPESNCFEQMYPYRERLVCASVDEASHLESWFPGVRFVRIDAEKPLPFVDGEFDFSFSNAVVEHVGSKEKQRRFVSEMCRVSRRVFITTPNRWFPVELHTAIPLLHYLPKSVYRGLLRNSPFRHWSEEANLNLLTRTELAGLFPENTEVSAGRMGIGFGFFASNLVAHT